MTAVPERENAPGDAGDQHTPRLTIGEVLAVLRDDFPDVTISKIRYLESEDLVHPQRTPSGYRKFSRADVSRLRYVLSAQRDHYLPLRVIKDHLEALDRGEPIPGTAAPATVPPPAPGDGSGEAAPLTPDQFARAAGLEPEQLADCVQFGLLATDADGRHPVADLAIARAAAGLARHGIEPRHLRVYRSGVEREAGLVEQLVAPVLRARSEEARARATEKLRELAGLSAQLHTALLEARLRDLLRP
ncbi:transcriptional regulator FtsR [Blastococcus goldschmidtiae]|uniref:MerR family transcriptional regulator n=1 Tax=Blastococcus goldschmidtiae TaxID=3075546 RepID=A0ABU2KA64_9ACTN|nr:MerR family transcriptional regulator [Blastococcus sp. DSM 46792]MDT0277078.1 MerR family transcriptional regulator [Blastococcus sp. DSM 46792]